jgi:hypothetical protein
MEQNLQSNMKKTTNKENLSIIRQSFANAVFTHKAQEVAAEFKEKKIFYIKILNIILVSLVLFLILLQSFYSNIIFLYFISSVIAIIEIIFLITQLTFGLDKQMLIHKNSALKYMGLRDCYRSLIADIMEGNITTKNLKEKRDSLQHEYQIISELAPQTGPQEYKETQKRLNKKGIAQGEEFTWSDEEIDHFLPEDLRLNINTNNTNNSVCSTK